MPLLSPRVALRSLGRAPAFALAATLTLALGIGLSTAVFTVADALLLRKLPVRDQERLVTLWGEKRDGSFGNYPLTIAQTRDFARSSRTLQSVGYFAYEGAWPLAIRGEDGDNVTRLRRSLVSGNYFDVLGVRPVIGRALKPSDDVVGAAPVAVISYATWQRQFGGDRNALGRTLTVQEFGTTHTIVGVMPAGLEYPRGTDFWTPFVPARMKSDNDTSAYTALDLVARLEPRATPANAQAELTSFYARAPAGSWERDMRGVVNALPRAILGDVRPAVLTFALAAALLMLITCIDVANLLLVRGLARVREIAVRSAIGASRSQILAQLMSENALLAFVGGLLGVAVAVLAVRAFLAFAPASVPLVGTIHLNAIALLGALGITCAAMLLFGVAPALITARANVQATLRSGTRESGSARSRVARETLVGMQVALAVLVLSAAAPIGRTLVKLERANLAFEPSQLLIAELALRYDKYDTDKQLRLIRQLVTGLRSTPGVGAVSPVVAVPFSGSGGWDGRAAREGQSNEDAAKNSVFNMELVDPEYFRAFGIRVIRGRLLNDADVPGAEPVIVVSESVARRYWPNQDPIGKRLRMGPSLERSLTVVGVVPDTRYRELREPRATVYYPLAQSFFPFAPTILAIRTEGWPAALVPAIRSVVDAAAPGVTLATAAPFESYLAGPLAQPRLNAFLLAVFAAAAVLLAAIGVFGVMATMVRQRTRELGVRMALGATARDISSMVVSRGLIIAGFGVAAGLGGAVLTNRVLTSLLYDVSPTDPLTLVGVAALLIMIAAVATLIPARSSARIDPAIALRAET